MSNINSQLLNAIIKSVSSKYSIYVVQIVTMMIYARWFTPQEFGVIATVQVFVLFFMMLGEIGLGPAIINLRKMSKVDRNGLFTLTIIIGLVVALLFYVFTFFLNYFYLRDDYNTLGILICIAIIFSSIQTLPIAQLQREKKFIHLALFEITGEIISIIVVYCILQLGYPLFALLSRFLCVAIVKCFLAYIFCKKTEFGRPALGWKPDSIKPILRFSSYQIGFNFLNYFSRNLDNILIGKIVGMGALGLYDKAYALMRYPLQLLTNAMSPAIQPVLSNYSSDITAVEKTHNLYAKVLIYLGVLAGISINITSEQIVYLLLGDQWLGVIPILEILAFSIPIQVLLSSSGGFYQACGRPELMFKCGVFSSVINVIAISIGMIESSLVTLSWALVISFHINALQCYWVMYRSLFKSSLLVFVKSVIPGLALFLVLIALSTLLEPYWNKYEGIMTLILIKLTFTISVTFGFLLLFNEGKKITHLFKGKI